MFALIIAIIAIALTVYLAVSTLFYGGDALSNGSARAIASSFINQGQQINGAHALYKNDNAGAKLAVGGDLQELVTQQYLSSVPAPSKGSNWVLAEKTVGGATLLVVESTSVAASGTGETAVAANTIPDEVCSLINEQAGTNSQTFGCDGTDTKSVWYRI